MLATVVVPMLLAQTAPVAPPAPMPPPVPAPPRLWPPYSDQPADIVSYAMSIPKCGTVAVTPVGVAIPRTIVEGGYSADRPASPITLTFRIDDSGRPMTIRGDETVAKRDARDEMEATMSAMRFRAGRAAASCSVTFTPTVTKVAEADDDLLYHALRDNAARLPAMEQVRTRLNLPHGGTCDEGTPDPLLIRFPDFLPERRPPGQPLAAIASFSIGADGVPYDVRLIRGSGNAEYDRLEVEATAGSRFERKPFTRCFRGGAIYPQTMTIVADTTAEALASPGCPHVQWTVQPDLAIPERFRKRAIEGWAIVAFDITADGSPANVQMLRSEPADSFGNAAIAAVRGGRATPGARQGCTQRLLFKMVD
ncbi:energy transducer TonB [Sphingomonas sp.]|uniref:energy transducer TonB n=1 Tax=Sphingomonas sp. TaxID=28214 RepID=UPI003F7E360A